MSSAILFYKIMKCNVTSAVKVDTLEILLHEYQVLANWNWNIEIPVPVLARSWKHHLSSMWLKTLNGRRFEVGQN